MWLIHTMGSYSALKGNEIVTHSTIGLNLGDTVGKEKNFTSIHLNSWLRSL